MNLKTVNVPISDQDLTSPSEKISTDELIVKFMPFADAIVAKITKSLQLPTNLREEFLAAAYYGLVEAANRFDWDLQIPFERFAYIRVRGAVIDYIRATSDLSSAAYRYARRLQSMQEISRVNDLAAADVGITTNLADTQAEAAKGNLAFRVSLSDLQDENFEIVSESGDPESLLNDKQLQLKVWSAVKNLPEDQAAIIKQYYQEDISFTDIAEQVTTCSKSWVCRLHQKALETLKEEFENL